jgi:uncharacterized membrane protein
MESPPAQPPVTPTAPQPGTRRVSLGDAKTLGIIGAIFNLIGFLGSIGSILIGFLGIIGTILVYIAVSKISAIFNNPLPRRYYLLYLVLDIVANILVIIGILVAGISLLFGGFGGTLDIAKLLSAALVIFLIIFIIAWILEIIGTFYLKKAYDLIKKYTRVDMFSTTGLLYFLGAILLIILIGGIILLVAVILELIAWASLPDHIEVEAEEETSMEPLLI